MTTMPLRASCPTCHNSIALRWLDERGRYQWRCLRTGCGYEWSGPTLEEHRAGQQYWTQVRADRLGSNPDERNDR